MDKNDTKIKKEEKHKDESLKKLTEKIVELENQVKRTLADYQNLEKRTEKAQREMILNSNKYLLLRLLPVLDTLMLASLHCEDKSLELSVGQFLDTLKSEGVVKIETKDRMFDPKFMECVETVEGDEGKVIEEVRPGYLLNDEVLRAAVVKVGKKTASSN